LCPALSLDPQLQVALYSLPNVLSAHSLAAQSEVCLGCILLLRVAMQTCGIRLVWDPVSRCVTDHSWLELVLFQIFRHWSRMSHSHVLQSSSLCVLHPGKCSSAEDNTAVLQQRTSTQRYLPNSCHVTCSLMVLCCSAHAGLWSVIVLASCCVVSRL